MSILTKFFSKKEKTELEIEEEIENNIIDNNLKSQKSTAIVIQYYCTDEDEVPQVLKICNFHSDILPSPDSIIWAPNEEISKLIPYKVIRYDFFEDPETDASSYVYIVVQPAYTHDVVKITNI